jgi:NTP pyrophosphatase (non-canonical NTP hydrolase)
MTTTTTASLDLAELRQANGARVLLWHNDRFGSDSWIGDGLDWSGADWSNAMCGEAGEAANVVKKIRRLETAAKWANKETPSALREKLGDELADTIIYADLLAAHYGIDLAAAVVRKFNAVSEREGFPQKLGGAS